MRSKAKKGGNIVEVKSTEDPMLYRVKVYINIAYEYLQDGYDPHDYVQVKVAERNNEERKYEERKKFEEKR